jgi:hypothetical protein
LTTVVEKVGLSETCTEYEVAPVTLFQSKTGVVVTAAAAAGDTKVGATIEVVKSRPVEKGLSPLEFAAATRQ